MLEFLGAGAFGILSGLIGTAVTTVAGYFTQKLKNKHDVSMAELDIKSMKMEAEMNIKVTKAKVEGEVELAEIETLKTSYTMLAQDLFDKSYMQYIMSKGWLAWCAVPITLGFAFVDFLKHLTRPALTFYMVGATSWLTYLCWTVLGGPAGGLTVALASELFKMLVMTVIYMTATCVGWWFGDRRISKFVNRLNDGNAKPKAGPMKF
jgi:hypothetical protein